MKFSWFEFVRQETWAKWPQFSMSHRVHCYPRYNTSLCLNPLRVHQLEYYPCNMRPMCTHEGACPRFISPQCVPTLKKIQRTLDGGLCSNFLSCSKIPAVLWKYTIHFFNLFISENDRTLDFFGVGAGWMYRYVMLVSCPSYVRQTCPLKGKKFVNKNSWETGH